MAGRPKDDEDKEEDEEPEEEPTEEANEEEPKAETPTDEEEPTIDPKIAEEMEIIKNTEPSSDLEVALSETLKRREGHISRLTAEVRKLKAFISKRKQTYKRKRKDEGAPTRALSAYNIFVQDRFSKLAKENEQALKSADTDAQLKRVPPASLVALTGNEWKALSNEEKTQYEVRAREDRKRYEEQMAKYHPPDKQANRKRNKTGYNMFFSAHVLRLKQSEAGVPSERGSVARLVGNAWKQLTGEEKQYYEREADKQNGQNPIEKEEEEEDEEAKRVAMEGYGHMHPQAHEMHMQAGYPQMAPGMQHDPRHGYNPYQHHMPYGQPYQAQDYYRGRYQGYPPPQQRHPYDQSGMGGAM